MPACANTHCRLMPFFASSATPMIPLLSVSREMKRHSKLLG
ncbi:hypothetical protein BRADI_1g06904v3 [Brachypodium distachyon]|uniref:Uncharacterized protein n=1 Tax=Brachypodium distachyon TaxID=15368 RepID=A0A0Q3KP73_BRADI|nr:hypothetical protein BRADI_1g06904v3 [Brachypodium distachyon]